MSACTVCHAKRNYGRSPACFECLRAAGLIIDASTDKPIARGDDGRGNGRRLCAARHRYRAVSCGNPRCKRCPRDPHVWYCYRVWSVGGSARETYVGAAWGDDASPYTAPRLRSGMPPTRTTLPQDRWDDEDDDLDGPVPQKPAVRRPAARKKPSRRSRG